MLPFSLPRSRVPPPLVLVNGFLIVRGSFHANLTPTLAQGAMRVREEDGGVRGILTKPHPVHQPCAVLVLRAG